MKHPCRLALAAVLAAACGGGGAKPPADAGPTGPADAAVPAPLCKTPGPLAARWFHDATAELGLAKTATLEPLATSVRAADLDGDEYPDVIATVATSGAREGIRQHFLFMNRPDPADSTGKRRILVDATQASGLLTTTDGVGGRGFGPVNLGDLDNDGDVDVVMCQPLMDATAVDPAAAFLNDGHGHFTLSPDTALAAAGKFQCDSAALLDYDRDGILDYWPGTYDTRPLLFHGNGDGTFTEVGGAMGLPQRQGNPATHESFRENFGVTACDLDGDGDDDVLLADYGRQANQVWRNDGDHFTEIGQSLGVAFDDRMDYSDDESYRCFCMANPTMCPAGVPAPNPTIACPIRGWVKGQSDAAWRLGGNTFSIACGDLDDDGDMDLMTAEIRHGDVGSAADPSELLINETPPGMPLAKFVRPGNLVTGIDRPETGIFWNEGDMMPVFADVDNDGRKDIYLTSSDYPDDHGWLWHQKADGTFEDVTAASGAGHPQIHGVALVDLDLDGDLDFLAGTSTARGVAPTLALAGYINDVAQDQNWVRIRLRGTGAGGSNVSAVGARVAVTAGGRTQVQEVSGGYGHASIQNDLALTFGLGSTCTIDSVEVRWPDQAGTRVTYHDVRANYRVEISQASGVRYLP